MERIGCVYSVNNKIKEVLNFYYLQGTKNFNSRKNNYSGHVS